MADHEVAKHTKKVYKIWSSNEHSFWHKFKEFFLEICIIVFAVSVSIWFHNMSEKRHDRAEGFKFLVGLKSDLEKDIVEMKIDLSSYETQLQIFTALTDSSSDFNNPDFIKKTNDVLYNTIVLIPNISRFEALKYSGKMNTIDNTNLLDEIINLYEEKIPRLVGDGKMASKYKNDELNTYTMENELYDKQSIAKIFPSFKTNKKLQFIFRNCKRINSSIIQLYHGVILQNTKIIEMIDEELNK